MPLEIRRTRAADNDLHEIWLYIQGDNLRAADKMIRRLTELFEKLAAAPEMGRVRPDISHGLRSFPIGGYSIFYRHTESVLWIVRVVSNYRDISAQAFPDR